MNVLAAIARRFPPRQLVGHVVGATLGAPVPASLAYAAPLFPGNSSPAEWFGLFWIIGFVAYAVPDLGLKTWALRYEHVLMSSAWSALAKLRLVFTDPLAIPFAIYAAVFAVMVALQVPPMGFGIVVATYVVACLAAIALSWSLGNRRH
jgi:hypothetical protein